MDDSLPSDGCPVREAITARNLGDLVSSIPLTEWRNPRFTATMVANPYPCSLPGGGLHARFLEGIQTARSTELRLCFHGTSPENINSILQNSLDPRLRRGQAHGPGEYL